MCFSVIVQLLCLPSFASANINMLVLIAGVSEEFAGAELFDLL